MPEEPNNSEGGVIEALAHPTRRRVLALLRERDRTPGELAELLGLPKPTLSGHLGVLRSAGLVDVERHGTSLTYSVVVSVLEDALAGLMELLQVGERRVGRPGATKGGST